MLEIQSSRLGFSRIQDNLYENSKDETWSKSEIWNLVYHIDVYMCKVWNSGRHAGILTCQVLFRWAADESCPKTNLDCHSKKGKKKDSYSTLEEQLFKQEI